MQRLGVWLMAVSLANAAGLEWPQFGGPRGNFTSDVKGLGSSWGFFGPKKLWSRDLGEGYSSITVDGAVLYTMYRTGHDEVVLAADANTGKTIWEYRYDATFRPGMDMQYGSGPHATPLVTPNGVYAIGILANLLCLDKKTGKVLWSHDLLKEFNTPPSGRGYAPSPVAYKDTVIVKVGRPGPGFAAFQQKDGKVVWKSESLENAPCSPLLITVDGQEQIVTMMSSEIVGIDPSNGKLLWSHPHRTEWGLNISTPVWGEDNILFVSSAYNGGSRALELHVVKGKTEVKELWATKRMRVHHGTAIRLGDVIYGSSGDFGPAPLTAIEAKTGSILWQDRSLPKASFVYADGKLIVVAEDGDVALATVSKAGLKILSKSGVLKSNAWTSPTLVGTKLYVRDRKSMVALDLH